MYRGTTTTITFEFDETVDLNIMEEVWITIEVLMKKKTFKLSDPEAQIEINNEDHKILLGMNQEDTLAFRKGVAKVQIRFRTNDGTALVTEECDLKINDILEEGVI